MKIEIKQSVTFGIQIQILRRIASTFRKEFLKVVNSNPEHEAEMQWMLMFTQRP